MKNELTAKRIQIALSNANMKPQELADKSGVGKASISQYVNGSHAPGNISAEKIGKVLNVNPMWLMGFDVEMNEILSKKEEKNSLRKISESNDFIISDLEKEIIRKFRQLDIGQREMFLNMLKIEEKRESIARIG